jgi:hypothetical protein
MYNELMSKETSAVGFDLEVRTASHLDLFSVDQGCEEGWDG